MTHLRRWALFAAIALGSGCGHKKLPPPDPPPEPIPEPVVEKPKPPPPKKCETIEDDCVAEDATRARIARSNLVFSPVVGWKYAQTETATVVQPFEIGAASAFTSFDVDPKKDKESRDAALTDLAKELSITLPKLKLNWKKPDPKTKKKIGDLTVARWQIDEVKRGERRGPLLIVTGAIEGDKTLLAIGFVPADDKTNADVSIMTSIDSIGPGKDAEAAKPDEGSKGQ